MLSYLDFHWKHVDSHPQELVDPMIGSAQVCLFLHFPFYSVSHRQVILDFGYLILILSEWSGAK